MQSEQVVVDSDVLIWHLRGHNDISSHLLNLYTSGRLFLSPITVAEIYAGIRKGEEDKISHAITLTTIIDIDFEIGRRAGFFLQESRFKNR
jgi:predicted nucleic acid-binding protein